MSMRWKSVAAAIGRFMVFVANAGSCGRAEVGHRCVAATAPERGRARIPPADLARGLTDKQPGASAEMCSRLTSGHETASAVAIGTVGVTG